MTDDGAVDSLQTKPSVLAGWPIRELISGVVASLFAWILISTGGHLQASTTWVVMSVLTSICTYVGLRLLLGSDPEPAPPPLQEALPADMPEGVEDMLVNGHDLIRRVRAADEDIPCPELSERLERLAQIGENVLGLMRKDPQTAQRSWKFVDVFLKGAAQVSEQYAAIHRISQKPELESNYRDFLIETEATFIKQRDALIKKDVLELDVEIKVLQQQMKMQ